MGLFFALFVFLKQDLIISKYALLLCVFQNAVSSMSCVEKSNFF